MVGKEVEPPKRLDITARDLAYGLRCCATTGESKRIQVESELKAAWCPESGSALTGLSVRTGFDAFLAALRLPVESHVLMSAVTIPDMVKIVEGHGLVPIPIDIDYDTLEPRLDLMEKALCDRTKLVVVSHVFGSICPMDQIVRWASDNGLLVVEDCAEAYCGPRYRGHDEVDISLFSFGTIKTETAIGGALMRVKSPTIRDAMRGIMDSYAVQPLSVFSSRLAKYLAFSAVLNQSKLYATFVKGAKAAGKNHLDILLANSRGFIGQDLFQGIRLRPPVPLLCLLLRRIQSFNAARLDQRRSVCHSLAKKIQKLKGYSVPGLRAKVHYFWLFPINVENTSDIITALLDAGFDATAGTTSLMCIDDVATERNEIYRRVFPTDGTSTASKLMTKIIYLPVDADTSSQKVDCLLEALQAFSQREFEKGKL